MKKVHYKKFVGRYGFTLCRVENLTLCFDSTVAREKVTCVKCKKKLRIKP